MQKSFNRLLCLGFASLFLGFSCSLDSPVQSPAIQLTDQERRVVEASNVFGFNLFKEVCLLDTGKENVFVSPLSVSIALGMTLNGARGSTKEAMRATLGFSDLTGDEINASYRRIKDLLPGLDPSVEFLLTNSIWIRQGFPVQSAFIDCNKTFFDALVRELDFATIFAPDTINAWVAANTHGRIPKIVDAIDDVVMYLINASYFKGAWTRAFDAKLTIQGSFFLTDNSTQNCPMMHATDAYGYFETETLQAIELLYGKNRFSMVILLPARGMAVDDIVCDMTPEIWSGWMARFKTDTVILSMPKCTFEYELDLRDALAALGMGIAFGPDADFSNMNGTGGLFISKVKHKTFVEVNEEDTEAAAVTSVEIKNVSAPTNETIMRIDRPFVFAIREKVAGSVLFIGIVRNPAGSGSDARCLGIPVNDN